MSKATTRDEAVEVVVLDHLGADLDFMTVGEVLADEGIDYDDDFLEDVYDAARDKLREIKQAYETKENK